MQESKYIIKPPTGHLRAGISHKEGVMTLIWI